MNEDKSIAFLAQKASHGDDECFAELCDTLKHKLFSTAKGILDNDTLALDAVSEAVFRAYKGIKRLRKPEYAETWFTRIVINTSRDIYKRQLYETTVETIPDGEYSDEYNGMVTMEFNQMIASLPLDLRQIISLKYYSDYTLLEISSILKIPVGTVKSRLNRALKLLRLEVINENE